MKRFATAMLVILALAGCDEEKQTPPPLPVTVAPITEQEVVVTRTWVGLLNGFKNADVQAQVTGYLLTQNYKEGSYVTQSTVLFTIDSRPFQAALEQAQADYAEKVAQAQLAEITLERQTQLYKTKVISEQEYDVAAQTAQASVALAAAAQASVQAAQVNLNYCTISAPFDGIVGKATAQIGDLVGPGGVQSVLTQISQLDPIKAVFSITEREYLDAAALLSELEAKAASITPEQGKIEMALADGKTYPHKGRFDFVNRQIDVATGSISLEALFPNSDNILRPGLFARITAPTKVLSNALVVPQQAAVELQGNYLIAIVGPDNVIQTEGVKLGPTVGAGVVVMNPKLKAGMNVVVGGAEKVRPGMKVAPSPFKPSPSPAPAQGAK